MVTFRYANQQREANLRIQRMQAARKTASMFSVERARLYETLKKEQCEIVRADAQRQWGRLVDKSAAALEEIIQHNLGQQESGMIQAAACITELCREAFTEAEAWQAEYQLEDARHVLALAYEGVEKRQREAPACAMRHRKQKVKEMEKTRSATVVAAPRTGARVDFSSYRLSGGNRDDLQGALPMTSMSLNIPLSTAPALRKTQAATRVVLARPHHDSEPLPATAAQAACEYQHERAQVHAAQKVKVEMEQQKAARRAAEEVRQQQAEQKRQEEEEELERQRIRDAVEHCTRPVVDEHEEGECPRVPPTPSQPPTATNFIQARKTLRAAEAAFEKMFVDTPVVCISQEAPTLVRTTPSVTGVLFQTVDESTLALGDDDTYVPLMTRSLVTERLATTPYQIEEALSTAGQDVDMVKGEEDPSVMEVTVEPAEMNQADSAQSFVPVTTASAANPPVPTHTVWRRLDELQKKLDGAFLQSQSMSEATLPPPVSTDASPDCATSVSLSSSSEAPSRKSSPRGTASPHTGSASSQSTGSHTSSKSTASTFDEGARLNYSSSGASESCGDLDTTCSSASPRVYPTMTAEQLRIALIRLRTRMRMTQR